MNFSGDAWKLTLHGEGKRGPVHRIHRDELHRNVVGYGHVITVDDDDIFNLLSDAQALALLERDLSRCTEWVLGKIGRELPQHQLDALVCWAYQAVQDRCRARDQKPDTARIFEYIRKGHMQLAAAEFDNWVYVAGSMSLILVKRRGLEQRLFMTGALECS